MAKVQFVEYVADLVKSVTVGGHKLLEIVEIVESHITFSGRTSRPKKWLIMKRRPSVGMLVYDLKHRKVVLVEQLRVAVGETIMEIPAGSMEAEENPYIVARHEISEEVGLNTLDLDLIDEGYLSPGGSDEYMYLFAAQVDLTNSAKINGSVTGVAKEGEDIRVHVLDFETFFKMNLGDFKTNYARMWLLSKSA